MGTSQRKTPKEDSRITGSLAALERTTTLRDGAESLFEIAKHNFQPDKTEIAPNNRNVFASLTSFVSALKSCESDPVASRRHMNEGIKALMNYVKFFDAKTEEHETYIDLANDFGHASKVMRSVDKTLPEAFRKPFFLLAAALTDTSAYITAYSLSNSSDRMKPSCRPGDLQMGCEGMKESITQNLTAILEINGNSPIQPATTTVPHRNSSSAA